MFNINNPITLDKEIISSPNLVSKFDSSDLTTIGQWVHNGYTLDERSRSKWLSRTEAAMDLALQIQKDKNFPWANCSNVAFPLVTIAALQFHARAYPALISGPDVARARVIGPDPDGQKKARADRISCHMSWQLLEQDRSWEEQQDRALLNISIVGTGFKKSYFSPGKNHNVSEFVLGRDLVLDYWAKSVEDCPRKTHIVPLYRNDIYERVQRGAFKDILDEAWYSQAPQISPKTGVDNRQGISPPVADDTTPFTFLEQHCSLDLDGDGYAEPYIITIEKGSKTVVRITTRFDREEDIERKDDGKIIRIRAMEYFTKMPFIPSPDGGIYDIGFGVLLGPLNESVNTITNQLIDAGTMATTAGGFLGRGAKMRGGVYTFAPLEWKRVDSTGDDLRKNIVPLEVREPSQVLFTLLSLLINYTNRISGSTDMLVGENPGQNTPAQTAQEMVQQGEKIYSALFKRIWRSMKAELEKLYTLNAIYLPDDEHFGETGSYVQRQDYLGDPTTVVPVADPTITSMTQNVQRAQAVAQRAMQVPGYDAKAVEMNLLSAMQIEGADRLYVGPDKVPQGKDVKIQVEEMKLAVKQKELEYRHMEFVARLMEEREMNEAMIVELQARAAKEAAQAQTEPAKAQSEHTGQIIGMIDSLVGAANSRNAQVNTHLNFLLRHIEQRGQPGKPT